MTEELAELSVNQVSEFLENFEFFTAAHTVTYGGKHPRTYDYPDTYEDGWDSVKEYSYNEGYDTPIGLLKYVDEFGGEDQGSSYWFVFSLTQEGLTRTFKRHGWYASHDGGYYDGPTTEVKPVEKTIVVWEDV